MNEDTPRERLARLETQFEHMDRTLNDVRGKVDNIHDIVSQAKGAKMVLLGTASFTSFVTALAMKFIPFLNNFPAK